jgi:hypothetical protein
MNFLDALYEEYSGAMPEGSACFISYTPAQKRRLRKEAEEKEYQEWLSDKAAYEVLEAEELAEAEAQAEADAEWEAEQEAKAKAEAEAKAQRETLLPPPPSAWDT